MNFLFVFICLLSFLSFSFSISPYGDLIDSINEGIKETEKTIKSLREEWEIEKYPLFLKNMVMQPHAWNGMRDRYIRKIIRAYLYKKPIDFTVTFTGSSVTAGHDNHFNYSYPVQVGEIMKSSFTPLNLQFKSVNVALGNNNCIPYNICLRTFAGDETDLVQWEQTYFCEGQPVIEQFVRQALSIPSQPIAMFTHSNTANWDAKDCKKVNGISADDRKYLDNDAFTIFTEINKNAVQNHFRNIIPYLKPYVAASIQMFAHHDSVEAYACNGPYIAKWKEGAASWHPSIIAHRFRASHYSYVWLSIWLDTLNYLKKSLTSTPIASSPSLLLNEAELRLRAEYNRGLPESVQKTKFPDRAFCLTNYEPREKRESSLKDAVISGLMTEGDEKGWKFDIYENIVNEDLVKKSKKNGYLDYKYLLYAPKGKDSGSLSVLISNTAHGPFYACQTPGIWGSLPKGFVDLNIGADIYLTSGVTSISEFKFDQQKAEKLTLTKADICYQLSTQGGRDSTLSSGHHVITVVPITTAPVILAWLVYPQ